MVRISGRIMLVLSLCAAVFAASAIAATTRGSSDATATAASSGAVPSVEALVPKAIKSKGTITVAADASYAPNEFIASDGHTVVGMDADLSKALAAVMGLKVNMVNVTFDTIIPGLQRRQVRHGRLVVHRHQGP